MSHAPVPWRSDYELSPHHVAAILAARFREFAGAPVEYLNEGWDSQAFLVADRWVFRFPKRREVERTLLLEFALLEALPDLGLPVPRYEYHGRSGPDFPYAFGGYAKLPGDSALEFDPRQVDLEGSARAFGVFLSRLHAFPADAAARLGARDNGEWRSPGVFLRRARDALPAVRLAAPPELARRAESFLGEADFESIGYPGPPRLVHGDLLEENFLVDPASGLACGVIDWGDVGLGDPAVDFAGFWHWRGDDFVARVLAHYALPDLGGLATRARILGTLVGYYDVQYGVEAGRETYIALGLSVLERGLGKRSRA